MPNLLPGQTTLGQLRELAAEETDQPTPSDDTNARIAFYNRILNLSYRLVIGLLVDSFQDYFVNPQLGNPYSFITDGRSWQYALPNDFFKALRLDCLQQPGNIQTAVTMRPYMNLETNQFQGWVQQPVGLWVPPYRITGNIVELIPKPPQRGLQIVVNYVPVLPDMADRGTITFDTVPEIGDRLVISAQSTLPQSLTTDLTQVAYVAIANNGTPVNTPARIEYRCGATPAEAADNLAAALLYVSGIPYAPWSSGSAAQDRSIVRVAANESAPGVVTIELYAALAIVWRSENAIFDGLAQAINLDPLPIASQYNPYGAWLNFCSVLNGFDELVIVDAAIKILTKQKQDTSDQKARWAQLWQDLRTQANNRNAANNSRITRTRGRRMRLGYGGFFR